MKKLLSFVLMALSLVAFTNSVFGQDAKKVRVKTSSGVIYDLADNGNGTYKVTGVSVAVTNSSTGQTVELAVNASVLLGATVSGVSVSSSGAVTASNLTFTPAGSTTPLTTSQLAATLQTAVTTAVTTAVQSGTLPPTTVPPTITAGGISGGSATIVTPNLTVNNNQSNTPPTDPTVRNVSGSN